MTFRCLHLYRHLPDRAGVEETVHVLSLHQTEGCSISFPPFFCSTPFPMSLSSLSDVTQTGAVIWNSHSLSHMQTESLSMFWRIKLGWRRIVTNHHTLKHLNGFLFHNKAHSKKHSNLHAMFTNKRNSFIRQRKAIKSNIQMQNITSIQGDRAMSNKKCNGFGSQFWISRSGKNISFIRCTHP